MKEFDLIVIGTGSAATTAAYTCREKNLKVAIIDERPYGGTCANRGCDPKKILVGVASMVDESKRMTGYGIKEKSEISWEALMKFKSSFTDPVPESREKALKEAGITCYHGTASFINEDQVQVGEEILHFKKLLIATGAKPRPLSIHGEELVIHSDDFLNLKTLPNEIVFIGGGFISFEFAHIAARAGAKVHILQRDDQPLKNFDAELVGLLMKRSKEIGINIHLNTEPESIEKLGEKYILHMKEGSMIKELQCNLVVHGAGRIPNIESLNLEKGKISSSKEGIEVDENLRSVSNVKVYAAGDVSSSEGLPLTPVAGMESEIVAYNLSIDEQKTGDYSVMPSIVFSIPSLASLGLTEEEAKKKGMEIKLNQFDTTQWYTYKRTREPVAKIKIVKDKNSQKILGVHILGDNAAELINYFALIMKFNLPLDEVKKVLFAYPTSASDLSHLL